MKNEFADHPDVVKTADLAKSLALAINGVVKYHTPAYITIDIGGGMEITVRLQDPRWKVYPGWAYDKHHNVYAPADSLSITVSKERGVSGLAADINRKIIPAYRRLYPVMIERAAEQDAIESASLQELRSLADMVHCKVSEQEAQSLHTYPYQYGVRSIRMSGTRAKIELDYLSLPVVRKVLELLLSENLRDF